MATYIFKEEVVAMSIISWIMFCVFVLIMGVISVRGSKLMLR